ncbi:MAG: ribonucleoside-diphosphate reductase, adenosylcobalamin-dependent [Candidatus Kerfeldbacteria bacterium CG15_BIG_FIL_POST_REV_8_21_14_020_45_12]|uniref:Vitamin B12-dependent ribonucleotide reductase n=1 Tax=Candidatus Kerfeldbacteria bacterium CG15_BIG_FIL_POST_REV_8_21_14_020_45_12 TaxID=2014247 RepID=A0A2M7H3Q0_9BACT|nr:MAG: ribonucleoside-diphosphate reductase, adenosylcobalamin-dependent [Candidatus Kerfeldbacteria bacterium CG15_BIG_FIL_POST_REV_8_21_14_020_45_12]PJA93451.1 MAG: ribonucleoside-diphosphate reductase, adenosylcobalamin-dependent [Candidatus Kerfeldbacteria bacterium CG_4_9_14_3_um_filter_45_8]
MGYELTGLREQVFFDRYALKDDTGNRVEDTPKEMWTRVAKAIASNETTVDLKQYWEKKFYDALEDFKFVPGGRILSGAGADAELTFYNCYVIPSPDDSRGGIFESVRTMVEIMSRGGGVGVNLSSLRPRGAYVKGVNGTASGAVSFGGLYSFATGLIIQGGSRRGALMLMLNDDHPDIEEFITVKRTMGLITNANLSVSVSDRFMEAVENDSDWDLKWEGKVYKTIKARSLWDTICESAHASGEPGVVFMERYNKESNSWYFEDIICVNPCGEQGLGAWNVCNLGAVNLAAFVSEDGAFDREGLKETVRTSVRFLDNVIDVTPYFFRENEEAQMNIRRTGLGTMGLGDALIKMKIRYGSDAAVAWCDDIYALIRDEAYRMSAEISAEKGAFPKFDRDKFMQGRFIQRLPQDVQDIIRRNGIRNGLILTQAPTGTTSILSGVSSGIEPVYDFAFKRKDRLGEHLVYHPLYEAWKKANPEVAEEDKPEYFVTAKELTPIGHVQMQAVIQKYTDSSISKTVNAPNDHTLEQVKDLYMQGYKLGCKGMTYFRDGSRDISVLESIDSKDKTDKAEAVGSETPVSEPTSKELPDAGLVPPAPRNRPEMIPGATYKIKTGYGTMYVTINHEPTNGQPFEVFATIGKAGGFFAAKSEAICRLISLSLRSGIPAETVIDQLKGIRGPMPSWGKNGQILSIPDAIAQVLTMHIESGQSQLDLKFTSEQPEQLETLESADEMLGKVEEVTVTVASGSINSSEAGVEPVKKVPTVADSIANAGVAPECPECGGILAMAEGCMTCFGCGYSKCA